MQNVVIVAATRTPIGAFQGALSSLSAVELGATVIRSLLEKTAISADEVDEVILGQVLTTGCGQNPARQTALTAGLSETTPAITINLVCGSGLAAVNHEALWQSPAYHPTHGIEKHHGDRVALQLAFRPFV